MVKKAITIFARVKPERNRKTLVNYEIHRGLKKNVNQDLLILTAPPKVLEYIDNRPESWNFSFHRIFEHNAPQDDVFESVARPVINSVFDGHNATIFAYGQTGSGKTYTMTGEPGERFDSERGILPRTLEYIFDIIRKNPDDLYTVEVAYLEIYNENGYDLLLERKQRDDLPRVTIQEDENGMIHLKNLSFRIVENEKDALRLVVDGDTYRAISETPMNPRSSRSHCIFTIIISVKKFGTDNYSRAKMHLVDLAGSERVYKCAIQGTILTEAKHINLSLHFLEQVIVYLGQDNVSHVPYRNSLLTSILRDSLGGNCLTTMLATLSVSTFNLEETISTCRFAQRVALVKNDVSLTLQLDVKTENTLLKVENEKLRKQIEELKKEKAFEYYKSLIVQRDQEISHLIDLLKRERARSKSVKEISQAPSQISQDEKWTQTSATSPISPRRLDQISPTTKPKRKHVNSLQGKYRTSPKKSVDRSPRTPRKIKTSQQRCQTLVPVTIYHLPEEFPIQVTKEIPTQVSKENQTQISEKIPSQVNEEIQTQIIKEIPTKVCEEIQTDVREEIATKVSEEIQTEVRKEIATKVSEEIQTEVRKEIATKVSEEIQTEVSDEIATKVSKGIQTPKKSRIKSQEPSENVSTSPSSEKKPAKIPALGFPQNVMQMIRTSRHKQNNESCASTPRSGFNTRNVLRNILCVEKNLEKEATPAQDNKLTCDKSKANEESKIENNSQLPLTGDPEIDEEIIAFYKAKRSGGQY